MNPENTTFGGYLRTLRTGKGLTMEQAARQASVHRATLDRWEKGRVQPHLPELAALLAALDASEPQKRHALRLLNAPRAVRQVRSEIAQVAEQEGLGSLPHGGDLLHALRMRRGVSLDDAARSVGVTGGTLRRWEKMEVWPSLEQLHRLCYALKAHEEEIVALTVGRFSQHPRLEKVVLEVLQERLETLLRREDVPRRNPLFDLAFLQLEADAWPLALRSTAGKQMLIDIYAHHAQGLSSRERLAEAGTIAGCALELMTSALKPASFWMYPVFISARASVFRGGQPAPKRGLERLRPWLSVARWPEMQAWMLADMANYMGLSGEPEAALTLAEQACRAVENVEGNEGEWELRQGDRAALLLRAGRPGEALAIVDKRFRIEKLPDIRVNFSLGASRRIRGWVESPRRKTGFSAP